MHEVCATLALTALETCPKNTRIGSPRVRSAYCNYRFGTSEDEPSARESLPAKNNRRRLNHMQPFQPHVSGTTTTYCRNWTQDDVYPGALGALTTGQSELRNIFDPKSDRKPRFHVRVYSAVVCMWLGG